MARGWDSTASAKATAVRRSLARRRKAVEDQQAAAEAEKASRTKPVLTGAERERQAKREALVLARAKLQNDLKSATDRRYRAMLEQAIAHLDREIG